MKIIKPIDLTAGGAVSSNAPGDGFTQWRQIGRDLSQSFGDDFGVSVAGDSVYTLNRGAASTSECIKKHNTVTGDTEFLDLQGLPFIPQLIAVSPDESYIAVMSSALYIISLATGQATYSRQLVDSDGGFQGEPRLTRNVKWSPDSSRLAFWAYPSSRGENPRVYIVNTSNFSEVASDKTISDIATGTNKDQEKPLALEFSSDSSAVFCSGYAALPFKNVVMKVSLSGATSGVIVGHPAYSVFHNPSRSEILISNGQQVSALSSLDLALKAETPDLSTSARYSSDRMFALSSGAILSTNAGTREKHTTFDPDTYADTGPILAGVTITFFGEAGGFYVVDAPESNGFSLIDRATSEEVGGQNPSVIRGVIYTYNDRNYEALQDNNDRPDLGALKVDPETLKPDPTWLDLGAINPLRMFDNKLDSRTTAPSPLVIDVTPGMLVNGLALFNVDASTVQITYTDPTDGLVYDTGQISMLDNSGVQDWYSFFFDPYLVKSDLARVDLPAYIDGTIQITLDGAGADVAIGEVVLGTIYQIGDAQYGSSAGILDFSRKEQDQFGNFEIVPRRFSKRAEFDAVIPPAYGGSVQRTLARLRATPIVWIGSVDLEETIVYGYFREFDILLSNPAFSNVTITVEGL